MDLLPFPEYQKPYKAPQRPQPAQPQPDPPPSPEKEDEETIFIGFSVAVVWALLVWGVWRLLVGWRAQRQQDALLLRLAARTRRELRASGIRRRRAPAEPRDTEQHPAA
jgi:hypothetical protein